MKKLTMILMIGCTGLALAQAPPDEAVETVPDPAVETVPADSEEALPEDVEGVETDPDFEATVEDVFRPGDEISEDYPIPLPADI